MIDFEIIDKKNKELFEVYMYPTDINFKVLKEADEYFEIKVLEHPLTLYKLADGTVSTNSLLVIKHYAKAVFANDYSMLTYATHREIKDRLCICEFKTLPLSKEFYVVFYTLDLRANKTPLLAIKLFDSSINLNNYFDITPTFFQDNSDVSEFVTNLNSLINIEFDEIVSHFSNLEFLYETRNFKERKFEVNKELSKGYSSYLYEKFEQFERTKLSFTVHHLFRYPISPNELPKNDTTTSKLTFNDVYCLDDIVNQFRELGELIKDYRKYEKQGIRLPYGVLLVGEPGTGKTLLINAFVNEFNLVRFDYAEATYRGDKYGGSLEDIFFRARRNKPAVIVIDEIDKININSVLFREMNGQIENNGILIIATANSTYNLNPALLRPGRFDRKIKFDTLSKETVIEMLKIKLANKKIKHDIDFETIANLTPFISGAHIDTYINEALIKMVNENIEVLTEDILMRAIELVDLGYITPTKYTEETKAQVRIHEAGHAIVAAFLNGPESIVQINTIPTSMGSGYVKLDANEGSFPDTTTLLNKIKIGLGGIVAEKLFTKSVSAGASNDLLKVRRTCEEMIMYYGLFNISSITTGMFERDSQRGTESTKNEVIDESKRIIEEAESKVTAILRAHETLLWSLVAELEQKPKLLKRDFMNIFNQNMAIATNEISSGERVYD